MLPLILYYGLVLVTAIVAWPHTYGDKGPVRFVWLTIGLAILGLPPVGAIVGVYYGLMLNSAAFFWASDSHMDPYWGTKSRRWRGVAGAVVVSILPAVWSLPLRRWLWAVLVPTVGQWLVTGLATPVVRRLASKWSGA